jgi:syntaxin 16
VDRIDYNITNVATSVEKGVKELVKAEETQKKGSMVLCVMVLIAL